VKIIVCVKQVPDTETKVKVAADGKSLDESAVNFVVNPYDEFAIEEAIRWKEKYGGETTAITLGPSGAAAALRTALAMGIDKAIHLVADNTRMLDSRIVATILADALKGEEFDVIFCGKKAVDSDSQQVGSILSYLLDIPVITTVNKIEVQDNKVIAKRDVEGGVEIIEADLPVVITAEKGLNEPRYAALKGIMMAKRKPLDTREVTIPEQGIEIEEMTYPPIKNPGKIVGEGPDAVPELVKLLKEEAKVL